MKAKPIHLDLIPSWFPSCVLSICFYNALYIPGCNFYFLIKKKKRKEFLNLHIKDTVLKCHRFWLGQQLSFFFISFFAFRNLKIPLSDADSKRVILLFQWYLLSFKSRPCFNLLHIIFFSSDEMLSDLVKLHEWQKWVSILSLFR